MKKIILSMLLLIAAVGVVNAQLKLKKTKSIKFDKLEYEFRKIPQLIPATYKFTFTNDGNEPLQLSVSSSCGCVTAHAPEDPVMPGKKDIIVATFNAASVGSFAKTITVRAKDSEISVNLTIKGEVVIKDQQ